MTIFEKRKYEVNIAESIYSSSTYRKIYARFNFAFFAGFYTISFQWVFVTYFPALDNVASFFLLYNRMVAATSVK